MLSVPNSDGETLYQQITQLSADTKRYSLNDEYENSETSLTKRLVLLKELAERLSVFSRSSEEYKIYLQFLEKLKKSDDEEVIRLAQERVKVIAENTQQQKRTKAVNLYNRISLDL